MARRLISSSACGGANVYDEVFFEKKKKQNKNPETINTIMNTSKEKKTNRKRKRKEKAMVLFPLHAV